ncbi:zeta toxin family protein [Lactobacillus sp. AN1001]
MKKYIIVAGVNGTGKSTLYQAQKELFDNTKRINADEILQKFGGDWRSSIDNIKAMKSEVREIHSAIENGESFHVETTLAGNGKPHINIINSARKNGYEITLIYIFVESSDLAVSRVRQRVKKGGHGVSEKLIKDRYVKSIKNLKKIIDLVDRVMIFDNTEYMELIYERNGNNETRNELQSYPWIDIDK